MFATLTSAVLLRLGGASSYRYKLRSLSFIEEFVNSISKCIQ